jgi:CHAD domain-containing protein
VSRWASRFAASLSASQANRTAKSPSPHAVHDLRVAIRRLSQGLATFKPQLPRKAAKKIHRQLKALLSAAARLRDCDIGVKILSRTLQPGVAELQRHIRTRRKGR